MSELDLSQCDAEPIHIPGSIQPHGALLGLSEPELEVVLESANAAWHLGRGAPLRGTRLHDFIAASTLEVLTNALAGDCRDANPLELELADGRLAHGLVHRSDGLLILEIESAGEERLRFRRTYKRLIRRFEQLRRAETVGEVSELAAREIRMLTGFDRALVYRFDARDNGEVIAEERVDEELEPYLGLHYPASDIPPQARRLYLENPLRLIVDAAYEPVPIEPDHNPLTGSPLDLSQSSLRSVSPIHCEYLRNMGVGASMSISLVTGSRLWGLIACHHRTPFHVPYGTRLIAEFVSHVLSARISELERVGALTSKTRAYGVQARLIDEMVAAPRFQEGLAAGRQKLTDLIPCDGAAVLFRGEVTRIGETPDATAIRELGVVLSQVEEGRVFTTDRLAEIYPPAAEFASRTAGVIAVPVSADGTDLLFWFRRERPSSVTWAGDPSKPVVREEGSDRLKPRASFDAWVEEVQGQSLPWEEWAVEVASDFRTALVASVVHQAAELERINARLVAANRHKDRFLATVSHELRNPLNAIIGWTHIARSGLEGEELVRALETIERNAQTQTELINDLLDLSQVEGGRLRLSSELLDLAQLVRQALETVEPAALAKKISIHSELGDDATSVVGDARRLQQVVWNLANNAIKFSPEGSRIDIGLERAGSNVVLSVEDEGAGISAELLPHVFEAFRQGDGADRMGLGLGLSIVKSIVELHGGRIRAESEGEGRGAVFRVTLPVAALLPSETERPAPTAGDRLGNTRILVVEDQADAGRMIAVLLEGQGASVRSAAHGAEALEALREDPAVDLVISDLDMPEMDGFAFVRAMRDELGLASIPAIALTAFTRGGDRAKALTSGFRHHVSKPVHPDELIAVAASLLGRLG